MLGDSQMPTRLLTQFLAQFSKWESIDTFTCANQNLRFSHEWNLAMKIGSTLYIYIIEKNEQNL
jgi:hypothetical protein